MNRLAAVVSIVLLGCASPKVSQSIDATAFCAWPGESVEQLIAKCNKAVLVMDDTEEGPLPAYKIFHGRYRYRAEIDSGQVELLRFLSNPLPMANFAIGDTFASVKSKCGKCKLLAGADEGGYISLVDDRHGAYLSFDTSSVATDWYFAGHRDESGISNIRLVSVNFAGKPATTGTGVIKPIP